MLFSNRGGYITFGILRGVLDTAICYLYPKNKLNKLDISDLKTPKNSFDKYFIESVSRMSKQLIFFV
ncbi:hypothetical protein QIA19_04985 (plasmid) [Borreliella finlandensis]|uniref:hypothetical protein n=1 Tax=Borreliella finlandensis TaxID=498741 RepID=UPI003AF0D4C4